METTKKNYSANFFTSAGEHYEHPITATSLKALKASILEAAREHTEAGGMTKWYIDDPEGERMDGGIVYKSQEGKVSYTTIL